MTPAQHEQVEALKAQGWKWAGLERFFGCQCVRMTHPDEEAVKMITPNGRISAWS